MRYEGKLYRPPSEADAYILQATLGCSWNHCTYCDMYRDKPVFRVRPVAESLEDLEAAAREVGPQVEKVFVGDGDGTGTRASAPPSRTASYRSVVSRSGATPSSRSRACRAASPPCS